MIQKEVTKSVLSGISRRQNQCPEEPPNNRNEPITHPAIKKIALAARHFWWPRMPDAIQKKREACLPCKMSGKNNKINLPSTETNSLPSLNNPNAEIQ